MVGNDRYGPHYYLTANGNEEDAEGLTQVKMAKCYVGFDFGNTWVLDKYLFFPYPQFKRCVQVRTESIEFISLPDKLSYTEAGTITTYKMEEGNQMVTITYNGKTAMFDIPMEQMPET